MRSKEFAPDINSGFSSVLNEAKAFKTTAVPRADDNKTNFLLSINIKVFEPYASILCKDMNSDFLSSSNSCALTQCPYIIDCSC
jgi:hypothetical protein